MHRVSPKRTIVWRSACKAGRRPVRKSCSEPKAGNSKVRRDLLVQCSDENSLQLLSLTSDSQKLRTKSGLPVRSFGLGGNRNVWQSKEIVSKAWKAGINYFFCYSLNEHEIGDYLEGLRNLCSKNRDDVYLTAGTMDFSPSGIQMHFSRCLDRFETSYLDCFFLEYVEPGEVDSALEGLAYLEKLKQQGLARNVGCTVHDRTVGMELVQSGRIDLLMARYNMAHTKAEEALFPAAVRHDVPIVAFTSTRWNTLQNGHEDWSEDLPEVGTCMSFALAPKAVQVVLNSTRTEAELTQLVLKAGKMEECEIAKWRKYGCLVYNAKSTFEMM
ncbi:hypothetical protein CYMTET_46373 [Cymbomonas tetramitiformis]|uniref:NADP-dependent oxidoreductase domain-containing protein n=1 Tax=Cymbomonas tetramitiformis TaxID=36881 RepID=A0AAE0EXN4_9CHLO|nr:hypothetical protein CYMTET_46373 [Cymbomonas tetramitiformis]